MSLSFDEIEIKSRLAYKKVKDKIIGFTEMGDVNDELLTLMNRLEDKVEKHDFLKDKNFVFVRGTFSKLCNQIVY